MVDNAELLEKLVSQNVVYVRSVIILKDAFFPPRIFSVLLEMQEILQAHGLLTQPQA